MLPTQRFNFWYHKELVCDTNAIRGSHMMVIMLDHTTFKQNNIRILWEKMLRQVAE